MDDMGTTLSSKVWEKWYYFEVLFEIGHTFYMNLTTVPGWKVLGIDGEKQVRANGSFSFQ